MNKILAVLVLIIVVVGVLISRQPSEFRVERSTTVSAPASAVFSWVNDYHKWESWSPWAKMDPNCKVSFEGPESGTGAKFSWAGNKEVGEGSQTITESIPNQSITIKLEFLKPFKATNDAGFTFVEQAGQTVVTWSMSGKNSFMGKAVSLFFDCDKMVGGQFEKGLASLKALAEAGPAK